MNPKNMPEILRPYVQDNDPRSTLASIFRDLDICVVISTEGMLPYDDIYLNIQDLDKIFGKANYNDYLPTTLDRFAEMKEESEVISTCDPIRDGTYATAREVKKVLKRKLDDQLKLARIFTTWIDRNKRIERRRKRKKEPLWFPPVGALAAIEQMKALDIEEQQRREDNERRNKKERITEENQLKTNVDMCKKQYTTRTVPRK